MITKSSLLVVAMLLATLATPRSAADTISDECGLASVYSTVSEEKTLFPQISPPRIGHCHSGRWSPSKIKKTRAWRWCASPIVALSLANE
ncbi:MAG: hypothetical protein ACXW3R_16275 [Rhodoplanes sp.]